MYSRTPFQNSTRTPQASEHHEYYTAKNYLNYINFNNDNHNKIVPNSPQRQPEQIAMYSINANHHPQPRSGTPNTPSQINRNPYINGPQEPRRQPPKQTLSRNSSNKEPLPSRQSQELMRNKTQALKNFAKTSSQGFSRFSTELNQSDSKKVQYQSQYTDMASPNYSKTVDLGAIKYQQIDDSYSMSPEEEELKQKLNYLEVLEQSLRLFERSRQPKDLKQLSQDNRQLMLSVFDQINRLKEQRSTKTISDCVSEVDNYSESSYPDDNNRLGFGLKTEKRRSRDHLSKSKEKDKAHESHIERQRRLNQQLKEQYEEEMKKINQKENLELEKLTAAIQNQQKQIQSLNNSNKQITAKLNFLPFYNEWQIMCGEAEGAKKTSVRIKEELSKRKEKLKDMQRGSSRKNPIKSQETAMNQIEQQGKGHESNFPKNMMNVLKVPPSPMNRPNSLQSSGNRSIPQSSIKPAAQRSRSINRSTK